MTTFPKGFTSSVQYRRFKQHVHWDTPDAGPGTAYGVPVQLAAWWKADTLGLSTGAAISSWADSSGKGITLTPGSAPTFQTSVFAPGAARFVGASTNWLHNTSFSALSAVGQFTAIVVAANTTTNQSAMMLSTDSFAAGIGSFSNFFTCWASTAGSYAQKNLTSTAPHVYELVFDGSQAGNTTRLIGNFDAPAAAFTSYAGTEPTVTGTTTAISVGGDTGGLENFSGDIAEILVYPTKLTAAQRSTIRVALGAKWSVPVTA
jgi:hypothetical protein